MARRRIAATTPGRFRLLSLLGVAAVLVAVVVSAVGAAALSSSTDRLRSSSAPALVATQEVFSSLAEADAAATAAFLSGQPEDREQRRLYEDALVRSSQRLTEVARLVGGSAEGRSATGDLAAKIATYAGLVEKARTYNLNSIPGGDKVLQDAIDVVRNDIAPDVATLTTVTQNKFNADDGAGRLWLLGAEGLIALAVVVVVTIQVHLARVTRRVFNLPLVAATLILLAVGTWVGLALARQSSDLRNARQHGYASVQLSGRVQTLAYRAKADRALALVLPSSAPAGQSATASPAGEAIQAQRQLAAGPVTAEQIAKVRSGVLGGNDGQGLLFDLARAADTTRERAAAAEMLVRWNRYAEAAGAEIGQASSAFNGFNLAVESVLRDNTAQFDANLSAAQDRLAWLRPGLVVLPAIAALMVLWGLQLRINEYR